ncbi:MAG: cupin domain-containing protein [Thermomicrobiales bacterium]|nr:cupin domain-containing protein [Thermomicrobiales bacterium]
MATSLSPRNLGPDDGEFRWAMDGSLSRFVAPAETTGGAYAIVEDHVGGGEGIPFHRHPGDNESFYILEGEVTFHVEDKAPFAAVAGSHVFIPGEVSPAFQVTSETARYLIVTTPRHEQFYRAISRPAVSRELPPAEPMDMEAVEAACQAWGVEILGPPPGAFSE